MEEFFQYIPTVTVILFALGIIGVIAYEKIRPKNVEENSN